MPKYRTGKPTKKSRLYLQQLEAYGAGMTLKGFCDTIGVSQHSVLEWRKGIDGFRTEEKAIRERYKAIKKDVAEASANLPKEFATEGLDDLELAWLRAYSASHDRIAACASVGTRWKWIEAKMAANPMFKAEYDSLFKEQIVRAADALGRKAGDGNDTTATKEFLRAFDPLNFAARLRHEGQVMHQHNHAHRLMESGAREQFRQKWLATFDGQLEAPKALPAPKAESEESAVIEGELVAAQ